MLNVSKCFILLFNSDNKYQCYEDHLLKYQDPPGKITGLLSFPVSGNTWLRYLIQRTTGYITGSFYFSKVLYENGFPGESIYNGSVIVIKSHLDSW